MGVRSLGTWPVTTETEEKGRRGKEDIDSLK